MGISVSCMCGVIRRWAALGALMGAHETRRTSQAPDLLAMHIWAQLGSEWLAHKRSLIPDFDSARRMINATAAWLELERSRLSALLDASNQVLAPLGDPLLVDFGVHRWLADSREEVYSDWLGWIIEQLMEPALVLPLFGINDVKVCSDCSRARSFSVEREKCIDGGRRRLDLVVRYGETAIVVIEVKVTNADSAQTAKQSDYRKWTDKQPVPNRYNILLATGAEMEEYDGFQILSWADLCIGLRRAAPQASASKSPVVAAMVLAFVGAVEQNLLGFVRPKLESQAMRSTWPELAAHIRQSLE